MLKTIVLLLSLSVIYSKCPKDQYCLSCDKDICEECIYAFVNKETGVCIHTATIEKCSSYSNANTCIACAPNFYLSENKCIKIPIENCLLAEETTTTVQQKTVKKIVCLVCKDGILAVDGKCKVENKCSLAGCRDCMTERTEKVKQTENKQETKEIEEKEVCIVCEDGFSVNPKSGDCVVEPTKGCLALDEDELKKCGECRPGFFSGEKDVCTVVSEYKVEDFGKSATKPKEEETKTEGEKKETEKVDKTVEGKEVKEEEGDDSDSDEEKGHILSVVFTLLFVLLNR